MLITYQKLLMTAGDVMMVLLFCMRVLLCILYNVNVNQSFHADAAALVRCCSLVWPNDF